MAVVLARSSKQDSRLSADRCKWPLGRLINGFPRFERPYVITMAPNRAIAFWTRWDGYLASRPWSRLRLGVKFSVSFEEYSPPGNGRPSNS